MASRSLEDFVGALDPLALEDRVRRGEDAGAVLRLARYTQPFLAPEAPVSALSADARGVFCGADTKSSGQLQLMRCDGASSTRVEKYAQP